MFSLASPLIPELISRDEGKVQETKTIPFLGLIPSPESFPSFPASLEIFFLPAGSLYILLASLPLASFVFLALLFALILWMSFGMSDYNLVQKCLIDFWYW